MIFEYYAKIIRVVDGDTLDLELDLGLGITKTERVRLYGINTAEVRSKDIEQKKLALKAKTYVEDWARDNNLECYVETVKDKKGKYGRYLVHVYENDQVGDIFASTLNSELVEKGLAKDYK